MPGRVKHRSSTRPTLPHRQRNKLSARMAAAPPGPQTSLVFQQVSLSTGGQALSKQTIAWIAVVGAIVLVTLIVISVLLCRCKCRKRKERKRHSNGQLHRVSYEVTDGRNKFNAWNRNAPPLTEDGESGSSTTPLRPAAVKRGGVEYPMEPVVVDEGPATAMYTRNSRSRYYSGLSSGWKRFSRISQIGRAY